MNAAQRWACGSSTILIQVLASSFFPCPETQNGWQVTVRMVNYVTTSRSKDRTKILVATQFFVGGLFHAQSTRSFFSARLGIECEITHRGDSSARGTLEWKLGHVARKSRA